MELKVLVMRPVIEVLGKIGMTRPRAQDTQSTDQVLIMAAHQIAAQLSADRFHILSFLTVNKKSINFGTYTIQHKHVTSTAERTVLDPGSNVGVVQHVVTIKDGQRTTALPHACKKQRIGIRRLFPYVTGHKKRWWVASSGALHKAGFVMDIMEASRRYQDRSMNVVDGEGEENEKEGRKAGHL